MPETPRVYWLAGRLPGTLQTMNRTYCFNVRQLEVAICDIKLG